MTDITATLSSLLVERHSQKPISIAAAQLNRSLDTFLKEAYQINRSITSLLHYLRAIRQPYLSTGPPPRRTNHRQHATSSLQQSHGFGEIPTYLTDRQREDIDSETSLLLNDINRNIANLSSAAKLHNETSTKILEKKYGKPSGFLYRWAAGDTQDDDAGKSEEQLNDEGRTKSLLGFREGVVWYLNYGLRDAVGVQQGMVEVRLERERERRESILWDSRNKGLNVQQAEMMKKLALESENLTPGSATVDMRARDTYNPALDIDNPAGGGGFEGLSPEQLQLFEEENSSLLNHYTDTLAKVTQAEKSLVEISSLQQTLVGHLTVQGEMVGQLVDDASRTDENVKKGNKELKKASERGSVARGVFWGTVGLCSFLIVWDLIF